MQNKKIAFLFDRKNQWALVHFKKSKFLNKKYSRNFFFKISEIRNFDIVFLINYTKIVPFSFLKKNKLVLLIHGSNLPKGKGFAPIQWQILERKSEVTFSLIEANEKVDSGDIIIQKKIKFQGTELYDEIRDKQAKMIIEIIKIFLSSFPNFSRKKQRGDSTFYPRRTEKDSELDINKTIKENFNLLRICNNEKWPAFFIHKGNKYILKIYKK